MNLRKVFTRSISENLPSKDALLPAVLGEERAARTGTRTRLTKRVAALALAAVLMISASFLAVAVAESAKPAALSFSTNAIGDKIAPGASLDLTVSVSSSNWAIFKKGIIGLRMEVKYDKSKLDYSDIDSTLDPTKFTVEANEYAGGNGDIAILVYPNALDTDNTTLLSAISNADAVQNAPVFTLQFTVKSTATGDIEFTSAQGECQVADYTADLKDFELVNAVAPASKTVTVSGAKNIINDSPSLLTVASSASWKDRVIVKINNGVKLQAGMIYYSADNGTTWQPMNKRVGSQVFDKVAPNDTTNTTDFFFEMPNADVRIKATAAVDPANLEQAVANNLSVFGVSYRPETDPLGAGLQFGTRAVRSFTMGGTYTLDSSGTLLFRKELLDGADQKQSGETWLAWLQRVDSGTGKWRDVPTSTLLDRCGTHVDYAARLINFDTDLKKVQYCAVAYAKYTSSEGESVILYTDKTDPISYNEADAIYKALHPAD